MHQSSLQIHLKKKNKEKRERKNHGTSKKRSNFVLREYESEVSPRPFTVESQQINVAKKNVKKHKLYDHWISNRSMKNLREISSFPNCVLHARGENFLHQDKPDQSRTFHNNLSVCGLFIIRYISPRLIRDKVEVQFLGKFFSSDALRVFLYQFIAISRGTGC